MDKRILVTGGSGLVGSQFIGEKYHKIGSKDYNLINQKQAYHIIKRDWDGVIHTAGKVGGVGGNMNHKGEFFYQNIMINTNVIESCRQSDIKNLVVFLSTCVFPNNVEYPLTEKKNTFRSTTF